MTVSSFTRHCVNLEKLEGRFSVDNTIDRSTGDYHCQHSAAEWPELATLR